MPAIKKTVQTIRPPVGSTAVNRAYSVLEVRSVNEDERVITGVATTPTPDRVGDIVEPMGITFRNPSPLLWQHRSAEPVGTVKFDKPTEDGVTFTAKIASVADPGRLKDRVDEAWQSVKLGLVRAVSIGFRALELSFMDDGGIRFIESEVLELSLVTIPANMDATIQTIKSLDLQQRAASGLVRKDGMDMGDMMPTPAMDEAQAAFMTRCTDSLLNCSYDMTSAEAQAHCAVRWDNRETPDTTAQAAASGLRLRAASGLRVINPPGVTGRAVRLVGPKEAQAMKTIPEQIVEFDTKRKVKQERMTELMTKASEAGETLDQAESEEYDRLVQEVKQIEDHIQRLAALEEMNKQRAVAVVGTSTEAAAASRAGIGHNSGADPVRHVISVKANVPKGTAFTRYAMAVAAAKGNRWEAQNMAAKWHDQTPEVELMLQGDIPALMKAAVGAGTTLDATFAAPLIAYTVAANEFAELLRPATIVGRIPGLRQVPFNIQLPRTTAGSTVGWVGEGAPKPVGNMAFDTVTMRWAKAAGIVVLTEELVRFSNPSAEAVVRNDLIGAMAQFLDRQFVDPSVAAVTNVSPASITNGVTAVTASGVTAAAFFTDVRALFATFFAANLQTGSGVWIMTQTQALALSLIQNTLGQQVYPTISAQGGTLLGYPVITSENIPATGNSPTDGFPIIFLLPQEVMLADDGQVVIDASNQASVNMDSAPDSPPSGTTTLVSLWQMNMVGLRAERWINWLKRRPSAVVYIQNAKYTG